MLVSPPVWCSLWQLGKYLALVNLSHPPLITCRSCVSGLLNSASRAEYTSHMSWVIGIRKVWRLMIRNSNSGWLKFKLAQNFHKSHALRVNDLPYRSTKSNQPSFQIMKAYKEHHNRAWLFKVILQMAPLRTVKSKSSGHIYDSWFHFINRPYSITHHLPQGISCDFPYLYSYFNTLSRKKKATLSAQ